MFEKIKQPELFQGTMNHSNYFEGWYFKQVYTKGERVISFIPGISLNDEDPHAFIQVIFSNPMSTRYLRYSVDEFITQESPFKVSIGPNHFSLEMVELNIDATDLRIFGKLMFSSRTTIKGNIMGPFAYIPKMQCNHGVLSMDHVVNGSLQIQDAIWQFNDEKGYIEKDWGTSFPKHYFWLQCNHFEESEASLMVSYAHIPFAAMSFQGLIAVWMVNGVEYRFATYNRGKIQNLVKKEHGFSFVLSNSSIRLEIEAIMDASIALAAPVSGKMDHTIKEGLGGRIRCTMIDQQNQAHIFEGKYAGIEWVDALIK